MSTTDTLIAALRRHNGHASSPELQTQLGVSQPTVSRFLAPLLSAGQVVKVGAQLDHTLTVRPNIGRRQALL